MVTQINRWLAGGCKWDEGTELYRQVGDNSLLLSLCSGKQSSFALGKLKTALKAYVEEHTPQQQAEEFVQQIEVKTFKSGKERKTGAKDEELTDKLRAKKAEIGRLYKEVIAWRREMHKLIGTADKQAVSMEEAFATLEQIDRNGDAIPVELTWVTYNEETKQGGEVIKAKVKFRDKHKGLHRFLTGKRKIQRERKDPRHDANGTVNLQLAATWEVRKVHTWCIFEINGRPVTLGKNG